MEFQMHFLGILQSQWCIAEAPRLLTNPGDGASWIIVDQESTVLEHTG